MRFNPLEGPIDPATYTVGPADMFYVALWGPISFAHTVPVTPEGSLILPTVGEVAVAGSTLATVKQLVAAEVKKRYRMGEVSVTLIHPRSFVVTLRGAVLREGQYVASATDRVEKILLQGSGIEPLRATLAVPAPTGVEGDPLRESTLLEPPKYTQAQELYDRSSLRNVQLIRKSGDTLRIDIPKYYATGDDRFNPYLLDGDLLVVPQRNLSFNFFTVDGAVNAGGRYEHSTGDDLLTALRIAGWFTVAADLQNVKVLRLDSEGKIAEELRYDVEKILRGETENPPVHRGDRILVGRKEDLRGKYGVYVSGEVRRPGRYPIGRDGALLSRVLAEAGGVTERALLTGSVVLRREDRLEGLVDPRLNLLRAQRATMLTPADSAYFYLDFELGRQPVVVDLVRLLVKNDAAADIIVQDDDIVYIASDERTVLVQGQVATPGYVAYVPGMGTDYYIERAGGFAESARPDEVKVIKAGSLEWIDPAKTTVMAGDRIWVPKKPRREFEYYLGVVRDVANIITAVTTTILLAIRIAQ